MWNCPPFPPLKEFSECGKVNVMYFKSGNTLLSTRIQSTVYSICKMGL